MKSIFFEINSIKQLTTVINCYIVFVQTNKVPEFVSGRECRLRFTCTRNEVSMNIIINNSSMQPIYEQIVEQIKADILKGNLQQGAPLPSVRTLSKDLRISALTVKKAYDALEQEGFVVTVHGKGSFVSGVNQNLILEEQRKEVERDFENAIRKAKSCGMSGDEILQLCRILFGEE